MMQHGGVVAREYGKPCVAGIEHVLTRFEDGQLVEVDGSAGTVRPLESPIESQREASETSLEDE
jgi:pyruvate,water dikinase